MSKPRRPPSYWRRHRLLKCWCSGYWFPHRRGGGACTHSPRRDYYIALREGATKPEAMAELSASQIERMFPVQLESVADDCPVEFPSAAPAH